MHLAFSISMWCIYYTKSWLQVRDSIWSHFGHQFSCQPTTGLVATKQKYPEKAGTIIRTSSVFHGDRWFCLWAMMILVLISMCNGMTSYLHEKVYFLMFVTDVLLWSESNWVHGTYPSSILQPIAPNLQSLLDPQAMCHKVVLIFFANRHKTYMEKVYGILVYLHY